MIPVELLDSLVDRFRDEFKHVKVNNLEEEQVSLKVFPQHLPNRRKDGTSHYPCIIIRLADGEIEDSSQTKIQFIIGVIDRNSNNQGFRDALTVANKIIESLRRNPMVMNKYEANLDMEWAYNDEDAEPYFFAGIETVWKTPSYVREDVEELI